MNMHSLIKQQFEIIQGQIDSLDKSIDNANKNLNRAIEKGGGYWEGYYRGVLAQCVISLSQLQLQLNDLTINNIWLQNKV